MLVAGSIVPNRLGSALEVAWGFADPPPAVPGPLRDADALRAIGDPLPQSTIEIIRLSALLQWLPLAGAGLLLIALRLGALGPRLRRSVPVTAVVALAVAVLVVDLFRANMGFNPAIPIEHAEQPSTPALRYLQSRTPDRFAGFARAGVGQSLPPNVAMRYGLYDARGYDYPIIERYDEFWRATAAGPDEFIPPTSRAEPTSRALRGMSLLSVTDVMQHPDDPPVRLPGLTLAYSGPDARVYRNRKALPRVFLVGAQRVVRGMDAALRVTTSSGFDARRVAVTERPLAGLPRRPPPRGVGSARIVAYEDERVAALARARAPSLLVLTDVHYPGWQATLDGRSVPIERVDYLLRGVRVPPGTHRVEFRYEPLSFRIGWIISIAATIGLSAVALVSWRRRRAREG